MEHYHRSNTALGNLFSNQRKLGMSELKLVSADDTKWNRESLKEKRLLEVQEPLALTLMEIKSTISRSAAEWFVNILAPFNDATVISSGEKYVTLSTITPLLHGLTTILENYANIDADDFSDQFCHSLPESLKNWFHDKYHVEIMSNKCRPSF